MGVFADNELLKKKGERGLLFDVLQNMFGRAKKFTKIYSTIYLKTGCMVDATPSAPSHTPLAKMRTAHACPFSRCSPVPILPHDRIFFRAPPNVLSFLSWRSRGTRRRP